MISSPRNAFNATMFGANLIRGYSSCMKRGSHWETKTKLPAIEEPTIS